MKKTKFFVLFFLAVMLCALSSACGKETQTEEEWQDSVPKGDFYLDKEEENPHLTVLSDAIMDVSGMREEWLQSWEDEIVLNHYGQVLADEGRELTENEIEEYRRSLVPEIWTKCHFTQKTDRESGTISIFVFVLGDENEGEGFSMLYNPQKGLLLMKESGEEFFQISK